MDQTRRAANRLQSQTDSIIMVTMLAKMVVMIITMRPGGRRDVMILNTEIIFFHSKKGLLRENEQFLPTFLLVFSKQSRSAPVHYLLLVLFASHRGEGGGRGAR